MSDTMDNYKDFLTVVFPHGDVGYYSFDIVKSRMPHIVRFQKSVIVCSDVFPEEIERLISRRLFDYMLLDQEPYVANNLCFHAIIVADMLDMDQVYLVKYMYSILKFIGNRSATSILTGYEKLYRKVYNDTIDPWPACDHAPVCKEGESRVESFKRRYVTKMAMVPEEQLKPPVALPLDFFSTFHRLSAFYICQSGCRNLAEAETLLSKFGVLYNLRYLTFEWKYIMDLAIARYEQKMGFGEFDECERNFTGKYWYDENCFTINEYGNSNEQVFSSASFLSKDVCVKDMLDYASKHDLKLKYPRENYIWSVSVVHYDNFYGGPRFKLVNDLSLDTFYIGDCFVCRVFAVPMKTLAKYHKFLKNMASDSDRIGIGAFTGLIGFPFKVSSLLMNDSIQLQLQFLMKQRVKKVKEYIETDFMPGTCDTEIERSLTRFFSDEINGWDTEIQNGPDCLTNPYRAMALVMNKDFTISLYPELEEEAENLFYDIASLLTPFYRNLSLRDSMVKNANGILNFRLFLRYKDGFYTRLLKASVDGIFDPRSKLRDKWNTETLQFLEKGYVQHKIGFC